MKHANVSFLSLLMIALVVLTALPLAAQTPNAGWLAEETARDYRKQARYPEFSKVLEADAIDPIRAKRLPNVVTARAPEGNDGPALSVWPAKVSFQYPESVVLYAALDGVVVPKVRGLGAEVVNEAGEVVGKMVFFDDGVGPDALAGDGTYTGEFSFPAEYSPDLAESFMVKFSASLGDGDVRYATGGFLYSRPAAKLTGRYRDFVIDGNLVVRAIVDVEKAGRFHIAGTLYTLGGEPVGTAQNAVELEPGRQAIDLTFYGLMFHDRQVEGPFRLGTVAFATTGQMPNALNELVENAHVTRPYRFRQFHSKAFGQSDLLQAAERLEVEAKRAGSVR